ncbi:TolC family protein, partial [Pseudomonas sp. PS02288]|uniref:TolC family protein n=1 Tax=Pseudomonas sp. PS02288 TaxID=2991443 RepID=UPI00249B3908
MSRYPLPLLALLALAGCSSAPEAPQALPAAPAEWNHAVSAAAAPDAQWWRAFASAELDALVAQGLADNFDLAAAAARLRQAAARARVAGAPLLPRLDGSLGARR